MTTRRTARICTDCKRRPQDTSVIGPELCDVCLEYADVEIMHMDYADPHAEGPEFGWRLAEADCPVCHPELDKRYVDVRKGHTNTVAKSRTSHAGHDHPATPKARAACRKAQGR